jgi:glycine betaine/proline transport system permease protein
MIVAKQIRRGELLKPLAYGILISVGYLFAYFLTKSNFGTDMGGFPKSLELPIKEPIDVFCEWIGYNLSWLFDPISGFVDFILSGFEAFLLWVPWTAMVAAIGLLALKISGWRMALVGATGLVFIGMLGLWDSTMITLSIIGISVLLAVAIGIPIGIAAALNDRCELIARPVLDTMQVMPAFVYLMPALFLLGVNGSVSVFLTVVFAIPPVIRLTNLGIRHVPGEAIETALSHGSTALQTLIHVQLPLAKPSIMMGINQTTMMALAMVIITALVGASGLGRDVWSALRRINSGSGFEAGLAIVLLAIVLDRLSYAAVRQGRSRSVSNIESTSSVPTANDQAVTIMGVFKRYSFLGSGIGLALILLLGIAVTAFRDFPEGLSFSIAGPINDGVGWMSVHLYFITSWIKDSLIREFGLNPIQALLNSLPWPTLVIGMAALAYAIAGRKVAVLAAIAMLFFGLGGVWDLAMHTLSQVVVAVVISVVLGLVIGILASQNDTVESVLRPVLDTMQTMPVFVYLIPVIMLWSAGPVTGIIATVIYALPPAIRMTSMGVRLVPPPMLETSWSHGSSRIQSLMQVQIPLAMPTIMMGVNQTVIMALSMVIIGGLVGGGGLGEEVYIASIYMEMGDGFVAGVAIVLMAIVLDRITQGRHRQSPMMMLDR